MDTPTLSDQESRYRAMGLVYYTPKEELLNCLTHGVGCLTALALLVPMLLAATTALSRVAAILTCLLSAAQFATSTAYHAARDLGRKRLLRSLDYPAVSLNVIACGTAFSLLYGRVYGYVALAISLAIVLTVLGLNLADFDRFKPLGVVAAFVVGALMFGSFLSAYLSPSGIIHKYPVVWLHLAGLMSSLAGAAIFGVHIRYMHSLFHVFVLVGPILCMVGNWYQLT
jgi:hemolysin III